MPNPTMTHDWTRVKLNHSQTVLTRADQKALPPLYSQDGKGWDAICRVHFFGGNYDFWATEFDPESGEFFGLARIAGLCEGELGYAHPNEWIECRNIERDLYWTPKPLREVLQ